jgi:hypothetical protein
MSKTKVIRRIFKAEIDLRKDLKSGEAVRYGGKFLGLFRCWEVIERPKPVKIKVPEAFIDDFNKKLREKSENN